MNNNNTINILHGRHTQTTYQSLIAYDPANSYTFDFEKVKITQSGIYTYLFCGVGLDTEYSPSYINYEIKIQHGRNEPTKELNLYTGKAYFNNKEGAAIDEEPDYVAYYYVFWPIQGKLDRHHWTTKSNMMYMKFHVTTSNMGTGYFAGKFRTHSDQHKMTIVERKFVNRLL